LFIYDLLATEQSYHYEIRDNECILYARGKKTLSEILIDKGLAMKKPFLKDDEFFGSFYRAESYAKRNKLGMWNGRVMIDCAGQLYKK
jgi:endonuclease YncB( thermonuclease family)